MSLNSALKSCWTIMFSLFISIVFFNSFVQAADRLVFVQAVWRHGDRSPTATWVADFNREDSWPQGWGQLTIDGMSQHVALGKRLRQKYINEQQLVSETYKNHEIYIRSTDVNRTLVSAISNLIGFYGETARAGKDYPQTNWPQGYIPIAVHTVDTSNDHIGNPDKQCPRQKAAINLWKETPEYKKLMDEQRGLFENLTKWCGQPIDVNNFWIVADTIYIENLWRDKLNLTFPTWATPDVVNQINKVNWQLESWTNGRIAAYKGFDFSIEMPKMRGGGLLWSLIDLMREKVQTFELKAANKTIPVSLQWTERLKYYVYSAHDTTLAAFFASLGFNKTNYDTEGYPHYSACVTVELWRKPDNSYYMKFLYWIPGETSTEVRDMTPDIVGCTPSGCTLDELAKRSLPYKAEPSPEKYCENTDLGLASGVSGTFRNLGSSIKLYVLALIVTLVGLNLAH